MFLILAIFALAGLSYPIAAQSANLSANELAHRVLTNELKAEKADQSHWMLRLETEKPKAPAEIDEMVETKGGDLKYPLRMNGHKLTEQERREAEARLQKLAHNPAALRKSQREGSQDTAQSLKMLKLLPEAFVFQYGERHGDLLQLNFKPNPHFQPPDREARVFHAMEGYIWVDSKQNRLAEISGHLTHEVKFGYGMLGHLDKGGTFDVKQAEVSPGYWELTTLNVQMNGKALFFKTISVQQKFSRSEFKRIPDDVTVAQGIEMLQQQIASQQAAMR